MAFTAENTIMTKIPIMKWDLGSSDKMRKKTICLHLEKSLMRVFLRVEPDVLYSKQIYIILKDWQWNVLDIKYLHLHFLSYNELELPLLNVFLPGSNLLWYELFFNIMVKKDRFQVKQNMSCLRMKQYRSASTSG